MTVITKATAEMIVAKYLWTRYIGQDEPRTIRITLHLEQTLDLEYGWLIGCVVEAYSIDRQEYYPLIGELRPGRYFVDAVDGSLHAFMYAPVFRTQALVYAAIHRRDPTLAWPSLIPVRIDDYDHWVLNLAPQTTLCGNYYPLPLSNPHPGRLYGDEFPCVACVVCSRNIGPFCWACGIRFAGTVDDKYCPDCTEQPQ